MESEPQAEGGKKTKKYETEELGSNNGLCKMTS